MKYLAIILILPLIVLNSCQETKQVTQLNDYQIYLQTNPNEQLDQINEQIEFWLAKESQNATSVYKTQLAGLYSAKYKLNGDASLLHQADDLLEEVNQFYQEENPGILRMLASNSITQHQFKKAYTYASKASKYKDKEYASNLILFDACMELGYYIQAEGILNLLENKTSFDYQVRMSKWLDHVGDLDQAIAIMEDAQTKISPNNDELKKWTLSNLGDKYGHQGKVEKSYQAYLEVLALDNDYYYALKGIAYIAYAKDGNTIAAKTILNYLDDSHAVPDYKLMLAEIEGFEGNEAAEKLLLEDFYAEATKEVYRNMYNKYILEIDLDRQNYGKAILMAEAEIENRATPQTYDLLAWTYYQSGDQEKALQVAQEFVENRTFEPDASYHLGMIYQNVNEDKSKNLLKDAKDATFELGPSTTLQIEKALKTII